MVDRVNSLDNDLGNSEKSDKCGDGLNAAKHALGVKAAHSADLVNADGADYETDAAGEEPLGNALGAETGNHAETEDAYREILGRTERESNLCDLTGKADEHDVGEDAAETGSDARGGKRLGSSAGARERITVQHGGDSLRRAGRADEIAAMEPP